MKLTILPSAWEDLAAGFYFYENQQSGLGNYFLDSVFADLEPLQSYAGHHHKVFGFHRVLSKRFPCAAYYSIAADEVCIRAVLDCRRDPTSTHRRLGR